MCDDDVTSFLVHTTRYAANDYYGHDDDEDNDDGKTNKEEILKHREASRQAGRRTESETEN